MITLPVSLVTSVLEQLGICSDCNIQLCWISEWLRLVNSGEKARRLLTDLNGNTEQSEQSQIVLMEQI